MYLPPAGRGRRRDPGRVTREAAEAPRRGPSNKRSTHRPPHPFRAERSALPALLGPPWLRTRRVPKQREHAREVTLPTPPATGGRPGGRGLRLRTRTGTHRRKWRSAAGSASTLRGGGGRRGQCSGRRRGREAGGDSSGPGEGETLGLASATRAGVTFQVTHRLGSGRAPLGLSPCLGPRAPLPGGH